MATDPILARELMTLEGGPLGLPGFVKIGFRRYGRARPGFSDHHHPGILEICYLASGRQVLSARGRAYELRTHDLFVTPPGVGHSTAGEPSDKCFLYYIQFDLRARPFLHFSAEETAALRRALLDPMDLMVRGDARLGELLTNILLACAREVPYRRARLGAWLTEFLLGLVACRGSTRAPRGPSRIAEAKGWILAHLTEPVAIAELAERTGLSAARFDALFRRETGLAPKDFILREKIRRAQEALAGGAEDITRVALDLGFSSGQYFATVFKRYVSMTPQEYRRKRAGKPSAAPRIGKKR
ncbi:MAG: helix-turn-helix transcriptional regulator [Spirochaetes bacterium]|nr:helix-turn-helix transcriptional regulator [Spirochaetota bacterium]